MGMAATLINRPCPFEQVFNTPLTEGSTWTLKKIGPGVTEEKLFNGVDEERTDDGLRAASDHNSSFWALLRLAKKQNWPL